MKKLLVVLFVAFFMANSTNTAYADVISSDSVMAQELKLYNKQQLVEMLNSQQVQQRLVQLGVDPVLAQARVNNMTAAEMAEFQKQIDELPAGQGIGGAIVTVLLVIALLDVLGVTDVYPFIDPVS
ncbi:MAG: PA2779 family protein [Gammaproteobacteria bacterium]|nr:PA2779 family protein [Gammaproteobacteria bacterium]